MFYVYILQSKVNGQLYIGSTIDLRIRLAEHDKGKVFSTNRYKPWALIYYEAYRDEEFARMRESRLKHHGNAIKELKKRIGVVLTYPKSEKNGAGFTLIELLIVIAILGILMTALISMVDPVGQIQKSNDSKRKQDLSQLQRTLEAYYNDNNRYPLSTGSTGDQATQFRLNPAGVSQNWGTTWAAYSAKIPIDPSSPSQYYLYTVTTDGQAYRIFANLQRGAKDSQACNPDNDTTTNDACESHGFTLPLGGASGTACGSNGQVCNYGVSSANVSP